MVKEMNEELGQVGGNRKKFIAVMIIAIVAIASIGAYLIFSKEGGSNYPYTVDLFWNTENTENAWLVKIVDILIVHSTYNCCHCRCVWYEGKYFSKNIF